MPESADSDAIELTSEASRDPAERWIRIFTGWPFFAAAAVIVAASICSRIIQASAHAWNDIRLVRSLALAEGIPLYAGRTDGVLFDVVYGPVSLPFYLPAAWLPEPKWALAAGLLTSVILAFGAASWLLWSPAMNGGANRKMRLLAIGLAFFHLFYAVAEFGVWNIHVDAPALAICSWAIYFAVRHLATAGQGRYLAASAVLAGLAPWTKQVAAPLIVLLILYFLLWGKRRAALWFGGLAISTAAAAGGIFAARFGFDEMYLSMFEMPSRHGMNWSKMSETGRHVEDLLDIAAIGVIAVMAWFVSRDRARSEAAEPAEQTWWREPWALCLATAAGLTPLAVVAFIKQGGYVNNLAYIDYFLMLAGLLVVQRVSAGVPVRSLPALSTGLQLALAGLLFMQLLRSMPGVVRLPNDLPVLLQRNPSQVAFEYSRQRPGETYFPWHPFAVYRAEGKLYHVGHAVLDRGRAGMPISEDHFLRYLPERMRHIAFLHDTDRAILKRLPEFQCEVEIEGLGGWQFLSRCKDRQEQAPANDERSKASVVTGTGR